MRRTLLAILAILLFPAVAGAATLPELLASDMSTPHEMRPHGVPTNYAWYNGPFVSPPAPSNYSAFTIWGQVYQCENAGYDADDVVEIKNLQTWTKDAAGWHGPYQNGEITGATYKEDYTGAAGPVDLVVNGAPASYVKMRMTENRMFHFYPKVRAPYDPATVTSVVVLGEARYIAYGGSGQCKVLGLGGDYWLSYNAFYPNLKGAVLGRLKHLDGGFRVFSATIGDPGAGPPVSFPAGELR
jgi:hypothetical protein